MARVGYKERHDNKNLIFVLCGTPGTGKTSLKTAILEKHRDIKLCPSVTTRPEKKTPCNIKEYHYITEAEYERLHQNGELITKKVKQFGFYYGIKPSEIIDILEGGYHVLLETTLWGVDQLNTCFNNVISIFVAPPSLIELKRRLKNREREDSKEIALRFNLAKQILKDFKREMVDYYIVNKDFVTSIDIVNSIVTQEKLKLANKPAGGV